MPPHVVAEALAVVVSPTRSVCLLLSTTTVSSAVQTEIGVSLQEASRRNGMQSAVTHPRLHDVPLIKLDVDMDSPIRTRYSLNDAGVSQHQRPQKFPTAFCVDNKRPSGLRLSREH